jgi:hypothetical protein
MTQCDKNEQMLLPLEMKLCEVPDHTWVKVTDEDWFLDPELYKLRMDGMYAHCQTEYADTVHLNGAMRVQIMAEQQPCPREEHI